MRKKNRLERLPGWARRKTDQGSIMRVRGGFVAVALALSSLVLVSGVDAKDRRNKVETPPSPFEDCKGQCNARAAKCALNDELPSDEACIQVKVQCIESCQKMNPPPVTQ